MSGKLIDFQQALEQLEYIVDQLENGNLTLEQSLEIFEQGIACSRFCYKRLDDIDAKIDLLLREDNGSPSLSPAEWGGE